MTKAERIAEIIDIFIKLGICEPWTEEQRRELIAERERIGAERFDQRAATAAEGVAQFIEEMEGTQ